MQIWTIGRSQRPRKRSKICIISSGCHVAKAILDQEGVNTTVVLQPSDPSLRLQSSLYFAL